jgi:hypothetical protein
MDTNAPAPPRKNYLPNRGMPPAPPQPLPAAELIAPERPASLAAPVSITTIVILASLLVDVATGGFGVVLNVPTLIFLFWYWRKHMHRSSPLPAQPLRRFGAGAPDGRRPLPSTARADPLLDGRDPGPQAPASQATPVTAPAMMQSPPPAYAAAQPQAQPVKQAPTSAFSRRG